MKNHTLVTTGAAIALLVAGTSVYAQNATTNQNRTGTQTSRANLANNASDRVLRSSDVIGMNVYNSQGDDVAEVNDLVLDPNSGKVRYAAVTYGGFLGMGDKMFAVPWEAFQCTQDPDDPEDHRLTLNVTKQQLEGAQGFDQDHWPNFADPNFTNDLDKRYRVSRNRDRNVGVDVDRNGVNVNVDRTK